MNRIEGRFGVLRQERRRGLIVGGALILVIAASLGLALRQPGIMVGGRSLGDWLPHAGSTDEDGRLAEAAFAEAGAAAIPFLTNALLRPSSWWEVRYGDVYVRAPGRIRTALPFPAREESRKLRAIRALLAVGRPANEAAIPALRTAVASDPNEDVRDQALFALWPLLPSDADRLRLTEELLRSGERPLGVALALLPGLARKIDCSGLIPPLSEFLGSPNLSFKVGAIHAAGAFGAAGAGMLPALFSELGSFDQLASIPAMQSIVRIDPTGGACLRLIQQLFADPDRVWLGAEMVSQMRLPAHEILALKDQVDRSDEHAQRLLQLALVRAAPDKALALSDMALLADAPMAHMTESAVMAAREVVTPESKAFLLTAIRNDGTQVRFRAVEGLRNIGVSTEDLPQLVEALEAETEPRLVSPLLELIGSLGAGGSSAREKVGPFRDHEFRHVRESAERALRGIEGESEREP